uniref:Uncharacterized protein n=1 Tax=Ditylenchus dipsaci TaxID=166011 RepID=A0A915D9T7_9BILA
MALCCPACLPAVIRSPSRPDEMEDAAGLGDGVNAEVYMRCIIYALEDLEKIVATGKAVVILKVIRSSKSKLNDKYFSTRNKNYMAFHIYYQKEKLSRVLVIAEVAGILTPYSFEDKLRLQLDILTKKMSQIEK